MNYWATPWWQHFSPAVVLSLFIYFLSLYPKNFAVLGEVFPLQALLFFIWVFAVVTLHRFETISHRAKLERAVDCLVDISRKIPLLFILHPPTRAALKRHNLHYRLQAEKNCHLLPRLDFFEFHHLFRNAEFVISDGGSNQEESYYLGIPCLLFREETERMEGIGQNVLLSGFDKQVIDDFVANYRNYRGNPIPETISPANSIIDRVEALSH